MRAVLLSLGLLWVACVRVDRPDAGVGVGPHSDALPRQQPGKHFFFGHDINVSGNDAIVGVPGDNAGGESAGAVYIFHRDADAGWDQGFRIQNPKNSKYCRFGHSVDISGDWAIAAARFACSDPGTVYVFRRSDAGNQWEQALELQAPEPYAGDMFGDDVAIEGDVLAIGQGSRRDPSVSGTLTGGPAYVSMRDPSGTWGPLQTLIPDGGFVSGEGFGAVVALSGDDLLVGSGRIGITSPTTAVYFYRRTPGTAQYTQVARLTSPDGKGGNFGQSAAIGGNLVVVGAPAAGLNDGRAWVFERPSATEPFGPGLLLIPPPDALNSTPRWQVGWSVATDGTQILVGAPAGREATLFARDAGTWSKVSGWLKVANYDPYSELGWQVAIDGARILVSDPKAGDDAQNGGMVYAP